ncbi:hypothetical protein [Bradyrhizobium elkanii]|uniref:hypothetical protein n=1 Tax=Bradyrhizobium elkanii TaxID=29448 RepID=UPI00272B955B|nr:hypothetical protein [Bradyrhizobium elkanii]WLA80272.1 hypothetical protein QNJ99_33540 [Bradyrhizobium elkanii]
MTRLASVSQSAALVAVAAAFISALCLAVFLASGPPANSVVHPFTDADAYLSILALMRGGSGYYSAVQQVLLEHGYYTQSVFNWRPPGWLVLLSLFPSIAWAQYLLGALAAAVLLFSYRMIRATGGGALLGAAAILGIAANVILLARPSGVVMSEVVTGILILLSVTSYGTGQRIVAVLAGLSALFIRELAAPYVLICLAFAIYERRAREIGAWLIGLSGYAAYFAHHWMAVAQQMSPADRADPDGWIKFGGIRFALETAHFNGLFNLTPLLVTAALLPAALLGLFAWRAGLRAAITVTIYLSMFTVIGKPVNDYWGALYSPLLMLGLPWSIPAIYEAANISCRRGRG